ncbi:MAG: iron ABC transporter permease, partial [Thioalkalispiraceae bacterium]
GSTPLPFSSVWQALFEPATTTSDMIISQLRLPRVLSGFAVGALLALAGTLMQVLIRNPLADPYILGISGGASVAALLSMLAGLGGLWLSGSAFIGALLAMLLVFGLAHRGGSWTSTRLLLTGVVMAAGWGALISFILVTSPERQLHGMLFWLMGDLGYVQQTWPLYLVLVIGLLLSLNIARHLNVLSFGELTARSLGVQSNRLYYQLYLLASLLTASAVTQAGSIGFVGLVVPHLVRMAGFSDHRVLIPAAALSGGILLVLADTLARILVAPQQLPVGVITALIGVPVFLYLLSRSSMK